MAPTSSASAPAPAISAPATTAEKHGPRAYVVVYRDGRQRQVYVPKDQVRAIRMALRHDARAQELIRQITDINLGLMRAGVLEESLVLGPQGDTR